MEMESCFLRYPGFKRKALTLSYDDGVPADLKLMKIMDKYGLKGTFNINPGFLDNWRSVLTEGETISLYLNCGQEIAAHGAKHLSLSDVNLTAAVKDVLEGREKLEQIFGRLIQGMAYANGTFNEDIIDVLKKCGLHYSRTTISTENFDLPENWLSMPATCSSNNPRMMDLAKEFVEAKEIGWFWSNKPMLFLLWGHSYEFDNDNNWDIIEQFAEYMGNREDVWYATNGEICDYVRAFHQLEYSVDGNIIYNPTDKDICLYYFSKEIIVLAGQTIYRAKEK